jgi:hypothetical protein
VTKRPRHLEKRRRRLERRQARATLQERGAVVVRALREPGEEFEPATRDLEGALSNAATLERTCGEMRRTILDMQREIESSRRHAALVDAMVARYERALELDS